MTVRAIQVPLDLEMLEALQRISAQEERHPRIQAARLLRDALRAQGELRETTPHPTRLAKTVRP